MKHTHITFVGGQSLPVYLGIKKQNRNLPSLEDIIKNDLDAQNPR